MTPLSLKTVLTRIFAIGLSAVLLAASDARAEPQTIEAAARAASLAVKTETMEVNHVRIFYRDVGAGADAVVLLHGFPETGEAFAPAVRALGAGRRLIIPDMRGFGRSARPPSGYDTMTVASDIKVMMDRLGVRRAHVVGYDIGARVAYAFALQYPQSVRSLTLAEAFIEGLAGTAQMKAAAPMVPRLKHFAEFANADEAERRRLGKEDELVLDFMNSRTKKSFTAEEVAPYVASFRRDRGMWAAFKYYQAFDEDAAFVSAADTSKIANLPVLTIGCAGGSGEMLERQIRAAGLKRVKTAVFNGCSHWIFAETPVETIRTISDFLAEAR